MKMVLLAAGHGRRFGGLKQLAPVGPHGEALVDYTVHQAASAGYRGVVLVVREAIRAEMVDHARRAWPNDLPVDVVVQGPTAGTVPAVLAAASAIDGPFAVANADDLYDESVFAAIARHFSSDAGQHVLVGYRLANTVLNNQPVKRGLCVVSEQGLLSDLVEHHICLRPDGSYDAVPLYRRPDDADERRILLGDELVSMNLWGFSPCIFEELADAEAARCSAYAGATPEQPEELLLPEVVGGLARRHGDAVALIETASRCIGLTHRDDVAFVQETLSAMAPLARGLDEALLVGPKERLGAPGDLARR